MKALRPFSATASSKQSGWRYRAAALGASWLFLSAANLATPALAQEPEGSLTFLEAAGAPGEVVAVPVVGGFERSLAGFLATFTFDVERLEYLRFELSDLVKAAGFTELDAEYRTYEANEGLLGFFNPTTNLDVEFRRVEAGEARLLGHAVFRVRALAEAGTATVTLVESVEEAPGGTVLVLDADDNPGIETVRPASMTAGSVEVLEPTGPRPVGDVTCVQFLDEIRISFTPSEDYDTVTVARDGEPVAYPPVDSTQATLPSGATGRTVFSVSATRDGEITVPVDCEVIVVSPAAPAVSDLACDAGALTWENAAAYDSITVFRDNEEIADLDGSAESFLDPLGGENEQAVYAVVAVLEGFASPAVHCVDPGIWIIEVDDIVVEPDATLISLPVYVTTSATTRGWDSFLDISLEGLRLVRNIELSLADTAGHPEPEFVGIGLSGVTGLPAAGIIYDARAPFGGKDLPVGLHQHGFNYIFRVTGDFEDGDVVPVGLLRGQFTLQVGDTAISQAPDVLIGGSIRFGTGPAQPVDDLTAEVTSGASGGGANASPTPGGGASGAVHLEWRNRAAYDSVRIERNGELVAEIAGDQVEFVDSEAPAGAVVYKVSAVVADNESAPARVFVSTIRPRGAFLRGDTNHDDNIQLTDAVITLASLFLEGDPVPCADAADANDDGDLSIVDPIATLTYLFLGGRPLPAPGTRHAWFDPTADGLTCRGAE